MKEDLRVHLKIVHQINFSVLGLILTQSHLDLVGQADTAKVQVVQAVAHLST